MNDCSTDVPQERQRELTETHKTEFDNFFQETEMSHQFVYAHRQSTSYFENTRNSPFVHSHFFYEIIYCASDRTHYLLGTQHYHLHHGDIVLIPPGVSHSVLLDQGTSLPYSRYMVWFSRRLVEHTQPDTLQLLNNLQPVVFRTTNTQWSGLERLFKAACTETEKGILGWETVVHGITLELITYVVRALGDIPCPILTAEKPDMLSSLSLYIKEHFSQDITLERISKHFFVSKSTVDQLFRKKFGLSFYRYLTQYRLAYAKVRIQAGEPMGKVCMESGFKDYSTFYRAFRREYGCSPSDLINIPGG